MDKEEYIQLELNTLIEEFKSIREEMSSDINHARQVVNITITASGILVASVPYIIQQGLIIIYLIAPFLFYPLAWSQIRYLNNNYANREYLEDCLIPTVRRIFRELNPSKGNNNFNYILGGDEFFLEVEKKNRLVLLPVSMGNYGINVLSILFAGFAYFYWRGNSQISTLEILLIIANVILFLFTVYAGFWARIFSTTIKVTQTTKTISKKS